MQCGQSPVRLGILGFLLATALLLVGCGVREAPPELVVGSAPDPESAVLAQLYAAALRSYGTAARVERMPDPWSELDAGRVSVVPGFTGRLLQRFAPGSTAMGAKNVYVAMVAALPEGVAAGDYATAAQDSPTVAVTDATATAWGGRDLTVLVKHCGEVSAGAVGAAKPPAVLGACTLPHPRELPTETALFDALRQRQINAAWTTTANPGIPSDVVVLTDRTALVQSENVVPLYRRSELSDTEVLAINAIAGEFDTVALADMRRQVAAGRDPRGVAEAWLAAHPLGR